MTVSLMVAEHHLRDGIVFFVDFKGHGMTTSATVEQTGKRIAELFVPAQARIGPASRHTLII